MSSAPAAGDVVATQQAVGKLVEAVQQGNVAELKAAAKALVRLSKTNGSSSTSTEQAVASVRDRLGRGMLHYAAQFGQVGMVEHLISKVEFDPNDQDNAGETPLALAAASNHAAALKKLLALGADPRKRKNDTATAAIHRAATAGESMADEVAEVLKVLIEDAQVEVDTPSSTGTPLCWAAGAGHTAAVKYLLKAGADPNNLGSEQEAMPALSLAIAAGSPDSVQALLAAGANPNMPGRMGATPLHVTAAVPYGNTQQVLQAIAQLLLEAGADPNLKDEAGICPLEVAVGIKNEAVVQLLFPKTSPLAGVEPWAMPALEEHVSKVMEEQAAEAKKAGLGPSGNKRRTVTVPEPEEPCQESAAQWKRKGDEAFVGKQFEEAVEAYTTSLRHDTKNAIVWSNRAAAYLRLEQATEALHDAGVSRTLDPAFAKAWYREGSAYAQLKQWEEAANAFYECCNLQPDNAEFEKAFKSAIMAGREAHQAQLRASGGGSSSGQ